MRLMPCRELQERYSMATNRATPEWGKAIFSDLCVILRPQVPCFFISFPVCQPD